MLKDNVPAAASAAEVDEVRRKLLAFFGAAGGAAAFPLSSAFAQTPAKAHRIDVHHHIVSPGYAAELKKRGDRFVAWTIV